MKKLSSKIIYGAMSGLAFASMIALIDYFEDFDRRQFINRFIFFGIAMFIVIMIKTRNKK